MIALFVLSAMIAQAMCGGLPHAFMGVANPASPKIQLHHIHSSNAATNAAAAANSAHLLRSTNAHLAWKSQISSVRASEVSQHSAAASRAIAHANAAANAAAAARAANIRRVALANLASQKQNTAGMNAEVKSHTVNHVANNNARRQAQATAKIINTNSNSDSNIHNAHNAARHQFAASANAATNKRVATATNTLLARNAAHRNMATINTNTDQRQAAMATLRSGAYTKGVITQAQGMSLGWGTGLPSGKGVAIGHHHIGAPISKKGWGKK